ncbi:MAG: DUF1343 domain-containing protein [Bacteriovoracaceae bacterium]|nr:DUF1343 domain-containing protein [Bacteriovoracaceae bacterium]
MNFKTLAGIDHLKTINPSRFDGKIGLLCHAASVDINFKHSIEVLTELFGERFTTIFSPQHGLIGNVQDNMVESQHFIHPYFKRPVYSLYSETRAPTEEMLKNCDIIFVDLQDVGCRIYTYIYSLSLLMEQAAKLHKKVVVLDRPNPIGLREEDMEGNALDLKYKSFVGMHPLPARHSMTLGEFAMMAKALWHPKCELEVVSVLKLTREMQYEETNLPWVLPSPNLPTVEAAYTFNATVMLEGTNVSEGRGTTRSLEIIGHPDFLAWENLDGTNKKMQACGLEGFVLRPMVFRPTFQKHADQDCGGFQIHVTDRKKFRPWRVGQVLMQEFYLRLGEKFLWKQPPYEYEYHLLPIDLINGTDQLRLWIEGRGSYQELEEIEQKSLKMFKDVRKNFLLYS